MGKVSDFLKTMSVDPRAKELLQGMKEPESVEEAADQYAAVAEKLGFDVPREGIRDFLDTMEKRQKALAAEAESTVKLALGEDALDAVAGGEGQLTKCSTSFAPGEWCWVNDSCSLVINYYDDPAIKTDNTYTTCTDNALVINTKDVYGPSGDQWESWKTDCPGGWYDDCASVEASKHSDW